MRARRAGPLALAVCLACATAGQRALPPIEPWGDLQRPYDDALERAAATALGPRPFEYEFRGLEALGLGEFWLLDGAARDMRERAAIGLVGSSTMRRRLDGVDSLPPVLEAIRVAPAFVSAYEEAARILVERRQIDRAHALAVQGLRLDGDSARLWAALAEVYVRRGDDARARTALQSALDLDAQLVPGGYETLAMLWMRAGETARADSLLRQSPAAPPAWLQHYVEGVQARSRGDLQAARQAFAAAAGQPGAQVAVFVDWGNAAYESGDLDAATTAFGQALAAAPDEPTALAGMALVQRGRGQYQQAVATFVRLAARRPGDAGVRFNLAGTSLDAAQSAPAGPGADSLYALAEGAFSACIDAGFRVEEARARRAHLRLRRGDAAGAEADARAMLGHPAHAGEARLLLARAALAAGAPERAVLALAGSFAADSLSADGLHLLGRAYLQLDRPRDAVPVLQRAHERQPDDWRTAMNYGVALSRSGALRESEAVLRPLAARRPDDADVLHNLAAVLQRLGQRAEAERLLRRAAALRR
jgi:tetratricopeptide (TPR) repeat protein